MYLRQRRLGWEGVFVWVVMGRIRRTAVEVVVSERFVGFGINTVVIDLAWQVP